MGSSSATTTLLLLLLLPARPFVAFTLSVWEAAVGTAAVMTVRGRGIASIIVMTSYLVPLSVPTRGTLRSTAAMVLIFVRSVATIVTILVIQ